MRAYFRAHWKAFIALVLVALLALFAMTPTAAGGGRPDVLPLAARLCLHVEAIGGAQDEAQPGITTARYLEDVLAAEGYRVRFRPDPAGDGHSVRKVEVSVANVAASAQPARIFLIGANGSGNDGVSGTAAVLELARLLKDMHPSQGTEIRFVFFVNGAPSGFPNPDTGNFIAFVGTRASSRQVQGALASFRAAPVPSARGMAVPAYSQGLMLSGQGADRRVGSPAIMIMDTAFTRYPYYHAAADGDAVEGMPDKPDYDSMARVLQGLARTIDVLAGARRG